VAGRAPKFDLILSDASQRKNPYNPVQNNVTTRNTFSCLKHLTAVAINILSV